MLVLQTIIMMLFHIQAGNAGGYFTAMLAFDGVEQALYGESTYVTFPSMDQILLNSPDANCGLRISGLGDPASADTLQVPFTPYGRLRARVVCVFEGIEPRERVASTSGSLELMQMSDEVMSGSFTIEMRGELSDNLYLFTGTFTSYAKQ